MAPMEKKVPDQSDSPKYSEECFSMASPTGKKFELPPNSSGFSAPNMPINPNLSLLTRPPNFVPNSNPINPPFSCNTTELQRFNRAFAKQSQRNRNPPLNISQSHLLSPLSRPSRPRRYHGNNHLNRGQAMIHNNAPLANNLSDGNNYPIGNCPNFGPYDANPNRSMSLSEMGCPQEMPTFHHHFSSGFYTTTTTQNTKCHCCPDSIGESSTTNTTTPIIPFLSNIATPIPRSEAPLDLHPLQGHKTLADLPGFGDNMPGPRVPARHPERFFPNFVCPACNHVFDPQPLNSFPPPPNVFRFGPPVEGAAAERAPLQWPNDVVNDFVALGEIQRNDNDNENINVAEEAQERRVYPCLECNATIRSGNAFGGHMSSHARKRKRDFINSFQTALDIPPPEDGEFFEILDVAAGVNPNNLLRDVAALAPLLGNPAPPAAAAAVAAESVSIEDAGELDEELSSSSSSTDMGPAGRGLN